MNSSALALEVEDAIAATVWVMSFALRRVGSMRISRVNSVGLRWCVRGL